MAEAKSEIPDLWELDVDQAIAICEGDPRAALKAALVANAYLESEVQRLTHAVSVGFVRRRVTPARQASEKVDEWRDLGDPKFQE
ncbi:MAG: hypothetical protein AB7S93_23550 [Xanthobacteraceae bacterium]